MTEHAQIKFILQLSTHYIWNTNIYFIAPEQAGQVQQRNARRHRALSKSSLSKPEAKRTKFYITVINFSIRVHS